MDGCSCHINPPCSFCTSLNEEEAEAFYSGGMKALEESRTRSKTTVKWLIEEGTFSEDIQPIVDEIRRQGMVAETVRYKPFESGEYKQFDDKDCVIVLGSINLIRQIQRQKPWIPGSFANFPNFDCMTYYAYFGEFLWNQGYRIMPLNEVKRHFDELQQQHGRLFIRPCSGAKQFTGQELDYDSLIRHQDQYGKPELPVVVAPFHRDIRSEFRLFCSDNKVIAGSMYYDHDSNYNPQPIDLSKMDKYSSLAVKYAESILEKVTWRPDKIFGMDIGIGNGDQTRLIEINSFSCSGWYKTPPEKLVAKAAELALQEWHEINDI